MLAVTRDMRRAARQNERQAHYMPATRYSAQIVVERQRFRQP